MLNYIEFYPVLSIIYPKMTVLFIYLHSHNRKRIEKRVRMKNFILAILLLFILTAGCSGDFSTVTGSTMLYRESGNSDDGVENENQAENLHPEEANIGQNKDVEK